MLKIIWYSTAPFAGVGYGNATKEILRRFRKEGHQVTIATKHHLGGQLDVDGVTCFDGGEVELVNVVQKEEKYDYIFSMCDDWALPPNFAFNNWINSCFLDTHSIHPRLVAASKRAKYTTAVTKFTEKELKKNDIEAWYTPLGVNTDAFKPDIEKRNAFRDSKGWSDDTFVIGTLGINYINDRKNFVHLLRAFKNFHERHPDSILYMHTDVMGTGTKGLPLKWIINDLGFNDNGTGPIQYVSQKEYHRWNISEEAVIRTYNSFDVFCFPTMGEGFGLPIIEAQSCGIPTIVTDTTSGKELLKGGWLIPVEDEDMEFSTHLTWIAVVRQNKIEEKLEEAYKAWKEGKLKEIGKKAREGVLEYDWDIVYDKYWKPVFDFLDNEKSGNGVKINKYPKYSELYNGFGHLYSHANCENYPHKGDKSCEMAIFPKLPNEPEDDPRGIFIRSYPIISDENGELYVHSKCPAHNFLPPKFVNKCKEIYKEVLSYPVVRKEIKKFFDSEIKHNSEYIKYSNISYDFNTGYAEYMQKLFSTTFKITPSVDKFIGGSVRSVLDVGCGEGRFINSFKEIYINIVGTEVNKYWINGEDILYGDVSDKLPFEDNSKDLVFCIDVLEHVKNPRKALSELFRVANNKLVLVVTATDSVWFLEDPTHIVDWTLSQWVREINEFGEIKSVEPDGQQGLILVEKRK